MPSITPSDPPKKKTHPPAICPTLAFKSARSDRVVDRECAADGTEMGGH